MEPPDEKEEYQVLVFRFRQPKNASDLPIPFHRDIADAIGVMAQIGNAPVLAFLLKMVLKDRITDDEIQLICDVYYHD
jgi:hypothetical protein